MANITTELVSMFFHARLILTTNIPYLNYLIFFVICTFMHYSTVHSIKFGKLKKKRIRSKKEKEQKHEKRG